MVYSLSKIMFVMSNWTFAFKYWIVSLTLKQALDSGSQALMSESTQRTIFIAVAVSICAFCITDSVLFWVANSYQNE